MSLHRTCSRQRQRKEAIVCMCVYAMSCMPSLHPHEWQKLDWDKTEMKAQQNTDAMLAQEDRHGGVLFSGGVNREKEI